MKPACAVGVVLVSCLAWRAHADEFDLSRQRMVAEILADAEETAASTGRATFRPDVVAALRKVARHRFVPAAQVSHAYENRPLSIGHGQTISQPYLVALMTDLLQLEPGHRVLEVGTGSGYQAAVLAELCREVYSIEIIAPLATQARMVLAALGYQAVKTRVGDGYDGWPEAAPFDAILVTAAASHVPPPLLKQLKPGGRMVIPLGTQFMTQSLMLVEKRPDGAVTSRQLLPVVFVPLTGRH